MCLLPRAPGPCQDRIPKWYFDNSEKRCMPFYYGGCEGNQCFSQKRFINDFIIKEMEINLRVKKSVNSPVHQNSCRQIFVRLRKRLGHAEIWWSASILILRWELARNSILEDVKVVNLLKVR